MYILHLALKMFQWSVRPPDTATDLTVETASGDARYLSRIVMTSTWPCWAAWCRGV